MSLKVLRGLPASGKSTYAKEWVSKSPESRVRVNRDDIRVMLGCSPIGTPAQEDTVTAIEEASVKAALDVGRDVVVDATHLRAARVRRWFTFHDDIEVIDFPIPPEECGRRDAERRRQGEPAVGRDVIFSMAKQYQVKADGTLPPKPVPSAAERPPFRPYRPTGDLRQAFIFDIDGTLAKHVARDPHDYSMLHTDEPHEHVRGLMRYLSSAFTIVVATGRPEEYRQATEEWLDSHDMLLDIHRLFMRPSGDKRPDDIVKAEMLHERIAPEYDVLGVFDDRDRVVAAWRAMGIPCYQVAPGDF